MTPNIEDFAARLDAARAGHDAEAAKRLIIEHGDGHETASAEYLAQKSGAYLLARLDAIAAHLPAPKREARSDHDANAASLVAAREDSRRAREAALQDIQNGYRKDELKAESREDAAALTAGRLDDERTAEYRASRQHIRSDKCIHVSEASDRAVAAIIAQSRG